MPGAPPARLWLQSERESVLIEVWDGNNQMPVRQEPELDTEHGRGLLVVESLRDKCGAYVLEGSSGKVVQAAIDVR